MTPNEKHDLARTLFAANRHEEALACLRSLLADEKSSTIWNDYGVMNVAAEKFDEAEAAFRLALSMDAHNAQAAFHLGILLHHQSRHSEAIGFLRQALDSPEPSEASVAQQLLSECQSNSFLQAAHSSKTPLCSGELPRRNVLLVHEILPHFDCSGADLRLFELVREIIAQGHNLTFLARDGRDYDRYAAPLQALGARIIAGDPDRMRHISSDARTQWSFRELLEREQFDVAILSHWFWSGISVPEHYLDDIRRFSPATRILVLSEDRHGERERRSWQLTGSLSDLERGNCFEQREMEIYARADLVLYVTETDQRHFLALQPHLQTEHLPTIAETGKPGGSFHERDGVLFLGNFDNLANRDALQWLLGEVWLLVSKAEPEIKLYVAGHGADPALAKNHPEIIFLGKVPDLAAAFAVRRVFAAPIRYGTGIITKNMHALAHGLPVVTTTFGAEGMQLVHNQHALISDDSKTFAESIVRLYRDESLWNAISSQGGAFIRRKFSLANLQSQIRKILARAAALRPQPFDPGHIWSYRAVETSNPEVLTYQPAAYRGILRLLAYWQKGSQHLDGDQPAEALQQFRHIFTLLRGRLPDLIIYSRLLQDMASAYRVLHQPEGALLCEQEANNLIPGSATPLRTDSQSGHKKSRSEQLRLSVVIPTYNRVGKLHLCLAALAFQTLPAALWEVIVVDDGSIDETESFCRSLKLPFPNLRYLRQENRGAGAARRLGVEAARGEILLLCNDDTIADNRLLAEHLRVHLEHPQQKWAVLGNFIHSHEATARALSFFVNVSEFFFPQKALKPQELYDSRCSKTPGRASICAAAAKQQHRAAGCSTCWIRAADRDLSQRPCRQDLLHRYRSTVRQGDSRGSRRYRQKSGRGHRRIPEATGSKTKCARRGKSLTVRFTGKGVMSSVTNSIGSANNASVLGQGIDVQALVTASLAGDQANIAQLQNNQSTFTSQITALQRITAEITNLQSAAFALADPLGGINALTASSSNPTVLSATASSAATAGTHTITVSSLATTSSYYSDAVASATTPLAQATGAIQISVGGNTPVTIDITSTNNTLAGLATTINNTPNIGVTASIVTDATGARLALVSNTSGAPGDLTVKASLHLADINNTAVIFHQAAAGVNSAITVDGVPVSTSTNTVSRVLNGVTLNLAAAAPNSPVTLAITPDTSKATDAVNQFVSAYNTVIKDINSQFAVNSDGSGGGPLEADGSARQAQSTLLSALTASIPGNNGIGSLASIGVNLNNDGTLSVDSTKLTSVLTSQTGALQTFLQTPATGFANTFASALNKLIDPGNGVLGLDSQGITASSQALSQQIADLQASLATKQQNLILVYSQVNATLQELPLLQSQLSQQLASA